jgi:hypothetical protein
VLRAFNVKDVRELALLIGTVTREGGSSGGAKVKYTNEYLLEVLRDFYVARGTVPPANCYGHGSLPSYQTFAVRFGSLGEAYVAAGLSLVDGKVQRKARVPRVSNDELAAKLQAFYREHGNLPTQREFGRKGMPDKKFFVKRFGGTREAYMAAGLIEVYDSVMPVRAGRDL